MRRRIVSTIASCVWPRYYLVAMELLNPFEVDDRHDTDKEITVLRDIDRLGDDCSMQPLVE